ncbi:hypothetical protein RSAG8_11067, partial [Rhizoctonia solani AG-8 WAC10335]
MCNSGTTLGLSWLPQTGATTSAQPIEQGVPFHNLISSPNLYSSTSALFHGARDCFRRITTLAFDSKLDLDD